jgi:hypothetical protein
MSLEKNKTIARRYQEEVWGKGNLALLDELLWVNWDALALRQPTEMVNIGAV